MSNVLGRWGRKVHRLRWWLFGLSVLSLAPAIVVLAPLRADARVARVRTAYDVDPPDRAYLSRDGRHTRAVVELRARASGQASLEFSSVPPEVYASIRERVRSTPLDVVAAGMVPLNHDFVEVAKRDLARAELVILPVVAVFLFLAFGSVVTALLPLGVGMLAMVGGLAGTNLLAPFRVGVGMRSGAVRCPRPSRPRWRRRGARSSSPA